MYTYCVSALFLVYIYVYILCSSIVPGIYLCIYILYCVPALFLVYIYVYILCSSIVPGIFGAQQTQYLNVIKQMLQQNLSDPTHKNVSTHRIQSFQVNLFATMNIYR